MAGAKAPRQARPTSLDALRGIAAVSAVFFHAYQHSRIHVTYVFQTTNVHALLFNLDFGVDWFLLLSGFLIMLPFARAAIGGGAVPSGTDLLWRRALRILPLYWVSVIFVWSLRFKGNAADWVDLAEHLSLVQAFDPKHIFFTIGPAWSLSVQVLFYISMAAVGPLLVRACQRFKDRRSRIGLVFLVVLAMLVASLAWKAWLVFATGASSHDYGVYFSPLAKMDSIALGMLVASLVAVTGRRQILHGRTQYLPLLAAVCLIAFVVTFRTQSIVLDMYFHTLAALALAMVLIGLLYGATNSALQRGLARPSLVSLGTLSYGIYLWHEPLMIQLSSLGILQFQEGISWFLSACILVLLTTAASGVTYWLIELPSVQLRQLFGRGSVRPPLTTSPSAIRRTVPTPVPAGRRVA